MAKEKNSFLELVGWLLTFKAKEKIKSHAEDLRYKARRIEKEAPRTTGWSYKLFLTQAEEMERLAAHAPFLGFSLWIVIGMIMYLFLTLGGIL